MKLIIDIPEQMYINAKADTLCGADTLVNAIKNGKPLPKRHGRLIDADDFKKKVCTYQQTGCGDCKHSLCCPEDAPTIIEADKEYEVEIITRGNCMMCGKELTEGLFFCKECEEKGESEVRECR